MKRPDINACRQRARMTNHHKEADVLALCDYVESLESEASAHIEALLVWLERIGADTTGHPAAAWIARPCFLDPDAPCSTCNGDGRWWPTIAGVQVTQNGEPCPDCSDGSAS